MNIILKYPSRGRPELFKITCKSVIEKLSGKHSVKFVFSFDTDDSSMNNDDIKTFCKELSINNTVNYNFNKNKIQAINADIQDEQFDILIVIQDDFVPILDHFDDVIANYFINSEYGLDCMLHFHTSRWGDGLDIYNIMGRQYYERFGYIYYPEYQGLFCDNEYTEVSKILGRNKYITSIQPFFHNHSVIEGDATEIKNRSYGNEDYAVYLKRKECNFNII